MQSLPYMLTLLTEMAEYIISICGKVLADGNRWWLMCLVTVGTVVDSLSFKMN
ncbi:hypothetical protein HanXRQr2_Chr03g0093031 [Helianthus annuus]|uniref:Uncharacterized protein n=1 Tax=Helianthus annuus TaxID=4232 RepID=A0A251V743_HELAN|nr:hypothetical protein HanXRQr2_Chr03g0093031 [Helianthus annuus]KAJ0606785.1 hypothetical protein HanHA89_Chr03g0089081 [Helianthus annuus]KAJ0766845.1 hypothetical protein HanLR1_Chr03g0082261 [Helianthus annuus]